MSVTDSKKHLLKEMYPYPIEGKKNAALRKGLQEYAFFLQALLEASHHFQNGDLEKFDSLVGENACQIRAIKIAILASKQNLNFDCVIERVSAAKKHLAKIFEGTALEILMHRNMSLEEVLEKEQLDIILSSEQLFLFQSFLLSEMKELGSSKKFISSLISKDKSIPKKLMKFSAEISTNFTTCVLNKTRKKIAERSVDFVRKIAAELNDSSLIEMTSEGFTQNHNTLPCMPMFWTYKTLLKTAQKESVPLVVHAQFVKRHEMGYNVIEDAFLFYRIIPDLNGFRYIETTQESLDISTPACFIQGVVEVDSKDFDLHAWKEKMATHSIIDIILAGAADHRQYPSNDPINPFSDLEYLNYRSIAKNNGFSYENPNTFFINHVFPMQVGRAMNLAVAN